MLKTLLIVDDLEINRIVLKNALCDEYTVIEAASGKEAQALLMQKSYDFQAVLLDIVMPEMDGYGLLAWIRSMPELEKLPVLMITGAEDESSRVKALSMGASDFIMKPYNPAIIKHSLKNSISSMQPEVMKRSMQMDRLTNLYNREAFFQKAEELIKSREPGYYILSSFDIDNFKYANDQYGAAAGDRILKLVSLQMKEIFDPVNGICARIAGDNFAVLYPNRRSVCEYVANRSEASFSPEDINVKLYFSVGRYVVDDVTLPVSAIYDRAYIAKQSIKGRYDTHMAYFDESMLRALVFEQEIAGEMDKALREQEFEVWLQPQYNHDSGALIGAEALVRWRHPVKGLMLPGDFIPVFEKNGFIYELDKFVWERSCSLLRGWIDEGLCPLPISVNISRYDMFRSEFEDDITGTLKRFGVPVELLRLEITESAFSETPEQIIQKVKHLLELGFTVEIDDFGSGYSSLNTLKDVPAQVLKLDMRFLNAGAGSIRSGSILESIVLMARFIGMAVIAEGVETLDQADFLKSIGCNYVQGYLYEKAIPPDEYRLKALKSKKEERLISFKSAVTNEQLRFINDMAHELLAQPDVEEGLNAMLGKLREYFGSSRACIFEFDYEKQTAGNTYENCKAGVPSAKERLNSLPLTTFEFWFDTFKKQSFLSINDVEALDVSRTEEKEFLQAKGTKSVFAVPLFGDSKLIGVICIDDPLHLDAQKSHLIAISDYVAVMIMRRNIEAAAKVDGSESAPKLHKQGPGLGETLKSTEPQCGFLTQKRLLNTTIVLVVVMVFVLLFGSPGRQGSHMDSFSESVLTLDTGWTLTDSSGASRAVTLPLTIDYGTDGRYTLSGTLPDCSDLIGSPALLIYSNYVDLNVIVGGESVLTYPVGHMQSTGATGNTYHYIRLPSNYGKMAIAIEISCQLGDDITYLLKPPTIGSKATSLKVGIMESMPAMMLSGCMLLLAFILAVLYVILKRRLVLNSTTAYAALFAAMFAVYVFCETHFAQLLVPNPYALFCATLMLLALLPIPLIGRFSDEVSGRFKMAPTHLMGLCISNFIVQFVLNYAGILSFRVMLPATHAVSVIAIISMAVFLFLSDRQEKPLARKHLLIALPMIVGGMMDIILLLGNRPSFNNSLWFTIGVTLFIIIQFCSYVKNLFILYRMSLEASVLREMAYRDALTGLSNRNAYERKLKELSSMEGHENLCCLVIDINDLKYINDEFGHSVGDAAIVETGKLLNEFAPLRAFSYRVGGDEFIVLIEDYDKAQTEALADKLTQTALDRGKRYAIPLSLAIGSGCYDKGDGSILDFVRRVDTNMYETKRAYKSDEAYPYKHRG